MDHSSLVMHATREGIFSPLQQEAIVFKIFPFNFHIALFLVFASL